MAGDSDGWVDGVASGSLFWIMFRATNEVSNLNFSILVKGGNVVSGLLVEDRGLIFLFVRWVAVF